MIKVNFLTQEYKSKIFLKKFATVSILLILLYVVSIMAIYTVINGRIDSLNSKRNGLVADIKKVKDNIVAKKNETNSIEDLTNKTKILEDILNQREYGFSDVLFQLRETIPSNVWLTNFSYSKDTITIKGFAEANPKEKISSGKNLLKFERNLKENTRYSSIISEYIKANNISGSTLQEFQYKIVLNRIN